jgi:hypothetical protein
MVALAMFWTSLPVKDMSGSPVGFSPRCASMSQAQQGLLP